MPYWRMSSFYLFYFASVGALMPYWALYLQGLGFGAVEIGQLMALTLATKLVAPLVWGWLADRHGRRMAVVRSGTLLGALSFAAVFLVQGFWPMALVMLLFSFFWNAALPQFEATTFNHLGDQVHRYSSIRLWGSVGFILAVAGLGSLLDLFGAALLPPVVLTLFVLLWLASLWVPERATAYLPLEQGSLWRVVRRPEVLALLGVCFLVQASHGPYYTFYTIYLKEAGYSGSAIGLLWALGVLAEVAVFLIMHRLVPRFGLRRLLLAALALTALRWVVIGLFVASPSLIAGAQLLHAASFGIYHAVAIALIHRYFTGSHQGRGQALYSSISFGAGGAFGALLSGYLWSGLGSLSIFLFGAFCAVLAWLLAWYAVARRETVL